MKSDWSLAVIVIAASTVVAGLIVIGTMKALRILRTVLKKRSDNLA